MRVQCPKCQTTLQLAEAPPPGVKIQCGSCGVQFGAAPPRPAALKPVVLPQAPGATPRPAARPAKGREIPEAVLPGAVAEGVGTADAPPRLKRKKRKRLKRARSRSNTWVKLAAALAIAVVVLGIVGFILWNSGLFRTRSLTEFNNEMVGILTRMGQAGESMRQQEGFRDNPAQLLQQLDRVGGLVSSVLADVKRIDPPPEGAAFYAASAHLLERLERFFKTDLKNAVTLASQGKQVEAAQTVISTVTEIQQLETAMVSAQHEFARQHGIQLIEKPFAAAGPGRNPLAGNPFDGGKR